MRGRKSPLLLQKMISEEYIEKIVNQCFEGTDKFLLSIDVKINNLVEIFIDGDTDVAIKDCVELSRYIEQNLDRDQEDFELRVSSAGLDRPFECLRQYQKYMKRKIEVEDIEEKKLTGTLMACNESGIEIEVENEKRKKGEDSKFLHLSFENIKKAKPVVSF